MTNEIVKSVGGRQGLEVDIAKYQAMLDEPELTESEKRQFIEALWKILVTLIDLGFDLHSAKVACGKLGPEAIEDCSAPRNMISLEDILTTKFDDAVSDNGGGDKKESGHEN